MAPEPAREARADRGLRCSLLCVGGDEQQGVKVLEGTAEIPRYFAGTLFQGEAGSLMMEKQGSGDYGSQSFRCSAPEDGVYCDWGPYIRHQRKRGSQTP